MFPNYSEAYHNRAQIHARNGRLDEAIQDFNRAIEFNPDLVGDNYNLSCVYALKGDIDNALKFLEKAVRKGYKNCEQIRNDSDLKKVRENPAFEDIMDALK